MLVKMAADEKPTEQVPQADGRHGAGGERNRPLLPDSHAEEEEEAKVLNLRNAFLQMKLCGSPACGGS